MMLPEARQVCPRPEEKIREIFRSRSTLTVDLKKQPPSEMSCSSPSTDTPRAEKTRVTGTPRPNRGYCRCSTASMCPGCHKVTGRGRMTRRPRPACYLMKPHPKAAPHDDE